MTDQEPTQPPKKSKGAPTWVWFIGTFLIVSLLGNVIFGGNTWVTMSMNFVNNTIASLQVEKDTSQDPFCLTGAVSDIDRENTLTLVTEADALVGTTTGAIGYAGSTEDLDELAVAINTVRESGPRYVVIGERLLTAKDCNDKTYEYLMQDFGNAMVDMGNNFADWDPVALVDNPMLLATVVPLIETAASKAKAILTYIDSTK